MKSITIDDKTCRFKAKNHTYKVKGKQVPGVTSITGIIDKSGPLIWWAVGEAENYIKKEMESGKSYDEVEIDKLAENAKYAHKRSAKKATSIGTVVHKYAEDYINAILNNKKEPEMPENEEAQESVIEFLDWWESNEVKPIASEKIVWFPEYDYAGTADLITRINGKKFLIDFKTSKGLYSEYDLQATAYLKAEENRLNTQFSGGFGLLRFPKNSAGFEKKLVSDRKKIEKHWKGFKAARDLYKWQSSVD